MQVSSVLQFANKITVITFAFFCSDYAFAGRYQDYLEVDGGAEFLLWIPIFLYIFLAKKYSSGTAIFGGLVGLGFVVFFPKLAGGMLIAGLLLLFIAAIFS